MNKGAAAISIILAAILGFVVGNITGTRGAGPDVGAETAAASPTGPGQADSDKIPIGTSPVKGPNTALATVVIFSDFQCPFCSRVEGTLNQLATRYGNDIRFVWKNNPLPFHNQATPAAKAAMAAGRQGKFWEYHDLLFQNQQALQDADLERFATQLHLDMARWRRDKDDPAINAAIEADKALAQRLNASGTPNFFVNGTNIVGAQPIEKFTALVDAVLARARTITPRNRVYAEMTNNPVANPDAPAPQPNRPAQPAPDENAVFRVPVGSSPALGPADALVTVVIFSDFQCPFCSRVEPTLRQLRTDYGNDIRFVWKNQPLEFHQNAMPAAELTWEAFVEKGAAGFWAMHDKLFENQQNLARADLERYAQEAGLNMARVRAALDQHTHQARIREDVTLAQQVQANGTPHFFINGKRLVGAQPLERFKSAIDAALAAARQMVASGTPRAQVYERIMATAQTAPAPAPAADNGGGENPNRVYTIRDNPRAPFKGNANARVVIQHFSDFQCPFCSRVDPTIAQVLQTYGDRVKFVWRNYPLPFHNNAMPAAEASAEAYAQQGNAGFWRFHDLLFQNQQSLDRPSLERFAQQIGLNMDRFRNALDNHTHQAEVRADMDALTQSGADAGTPASFVNGRFVSGAVPFEQFKTAIDAALAAGR